MHERIGHPVQQQGVDALREGRQWQAVAPALEVARQEMVEAEVDDDPGEAPRRRPEAGPAGDDHGMVVGVAVDAAVERQPGAQRLRPVVAETALDEVAHQPAQHHLGMRAGQQGVGEVVQGGPAGCPADTPPPVSRLRRRPW